MFDLGVRKDLSTASKTWQEMLASGLMSVEHGLDVAETLVAHGIDLKSINAVIWRYAVFALVTARSFTLN